MPRPGPGAGRGPRVVLVVVAVLVVVVAAGGIAVEPVLATAGFRLGGVVGGLSLVLTPVARALALLALCGVMGTLALAAVAPARRGRPGPPYPGLGVAASRWALVWALATLTSGVLQLVASDSVSWVDGHPAGLTQDDAAGAVRGLVLTLCGAGLVSVLARAARSRDELVGVWLLAALAFTPTGLTSHAVHADGGLVAGLALVVHVVAITTWVGGVLTLLVQRSPLGEDPALPRRFGVVALVCYVVAVATGLTLALDRAGWAVLTGTGGAYSALLLAKVVLFVALGAVGLLHRTRTLPRLEVGEPGAYRSLLAGELVVMTLTLGLGVLLATTPLP